VITGQSDPNIILFLSCPAGSRGKKGRGENFRLPALIYQFILFSFLFSNRKPRRRKRKEGEGGGSRRRRRPCPIGLENISGASSPCLPACRADGKGGRRRRREGKKETRKRIGACRRSDIIPCMVGCEFYSLYAVLEKKRERRKPSLPFCGEKRRKGTAAISFPHLCVVLSVLLEACLLASSRGKRREGGGERDNRRRFPARRRMLVLYLYSHAPPGSLL